MSDIQLFRVTGGKVTQLEGKPSALEKPLQQLFEKNLEALLGVRLIKTEVVTGKLHGGRIDSLGIDENGCPVIIEYKASVNENVINQGLFYLDWLLDHRGDFGMLVLEMFGKEVADDIDWDGPRLICIAEEFTRYDQHAVRQIDRNIDLIRYRHFGDDLLLVDLFHTSSAEKPSGTAHKATPIAPKKPVPAGATPSNEKTVVENLASTTPELRALFDVVSNHLLSLGDDVTVNQKKFYLAFRRIKNFACLEAYKTKVLLHLKVDPKTVTIETGFTRDMSETGHFGTGDLQITLTTLADFEKAKPLLQRAYEGT